MQPPRRRGPLHKLYTFVTRPGGARSAFNLVGVEAGRLVDGRLGVGGVDLRGHIGRLLEGAAPVGGLGRRDVEENRLGRGRDDLGENGGAKELQRTN